MPTRCKSDKDSSWSKLKDMSADQRSKLNINIFMQSLNESIELKCDSLFQI